MDPLPGIVLLHYDFLPALQNNTLLCFVPFYLVTHNTLTSKKIAWFQHCLFVGVWYYGRKNFIGLFSLQAIQKCITNVRIVLTRKRTLRRLFMYFYLLFRYWFSICHSIFFENDTFMLDVFPFSIIIVFLQFLRFSLFPSSCAHCSTIHLSTYSFCKCAKS